ncbi:lysophospholipid acyltransferase family protein [Campylobacter sp. US33a]|uniref:lysophospholipid acyltransferase family protein n=1 Tax=Campylobacter sp. US33a TaxID=2498120 RepID=UPI0010677150|nr:lysophospholipid acyltransferase family protein [Campylobacter sp. US33a]TEY02709.1 DUF374 domain-containing protein [Campylobacter sp. US33a]
MGKSFKYSFLAFGIYILQWLIFLTCKKEYLGQKLDDTPFVILFWHGRLALMPFAFRYFEKKGKKAYVMISHHKDGDLIAKNIEFFKINTIRGSSSKGAISALREAFKVLDKKDDVVITPDGPRGPYHGIADGCIALAQKCKVKILLLNYEASAYWEFKSWDRMILPKPFSKIVYRISEPIEVENLDIDEAKKRIQINFDMMYQMDGFKNKE